MKTHTKRPALRVALPSDPPRAPFQSPASPTIDRSPVSYLDVSPQCGYTSYGSYIDRYLSDDVRKDEWSDTLNLSPKSSGNGNVRIFVQPSSWPESTRAIASPVVTETSAKAEKDVTAKANKKVLGKVSPGARWCCPDGMGAALIDSCRWLDD